MLVCTVQAVCRFQRDAVRAKTGRVRKGEKAISLSRLARNAVGAAHPIKRSGAPSWPAVAARVRGFMRQDGALAPSHDPLWGNFTIVHSEAIPDAAVGRECPRRANRFAHNAFQHAAFVDDDPAGGFACTGISLALCLASPRVAAVLKRRRLVMTTRVPVR